MQWLDLGPTKRKILHFMNSSVSFYAWHAERNEVFTNLFKLTDHDFDNRVYLTRGIATFQTMESWIILWRWKFEFQWETTGKESQLANAPPNPDHQLKERGSQFQGIQFLNFNFKGYLLLHWTPSSSAFPIEVALSESAPDRLRPDSISGQNDFFAIQIEILFSLACLISFQ